MEFDKGSYCTNCEYFIDKQKYQIDEEVLRQDKSFYITLPYANKKVREICMNMVNNTYNSTEDMNNKLQELKGKTKLEFYKKFYK